MTTERTCDIKGCGELATHRAEIVIYGRSSVPHQPAIGTMGICVCERHARERNANELLVPAGKREIEEGFRRIGRALPDWSRSFARWVKITKAA